MGYNMSLEPEATLVGIGMQMKFPYKNQKGSTKFRGPEIPVVCCIDKNNKMRFYIDNKNGSCDNELRCLKRELAKDEFGDMIYRIRKQTPLGQICV